MSGHSKWSTIKRKKGAADAKRGQVFTRLTRELLMAAREAGADVETNFRLRLAIERARAQNMPKDNIERAIKRGTGEAKEGEAFEEVTYEGYAPSGVALMIKCVTENRNRTVAEIRHALARAGGSLGEGGSVAWQFKHMAYFSLSSDGLDFDKIFEMAVEAGADDVTQEGDMIEIYAPVVHFKTLNDRFRIAKVDIEEAELRMVPKQEMELDFNDTEKVLKSIEVLEELDDVHSVFSNLHISEEVLAKLGQE